MNKNLLDKEEQQLKYLKFYDIFPLAMFIFLCSIGFIYGIAMVITTNSVGVMFGYWFAGVAAGAAAYAILKLSFAHKIMQLIYLEKILSEQKNPGSVDAYEQERQAAIAAQEAARMAMMQSMMMQGMPMQGAPVQPGYAPQMPVEPVAPVEPAAPVEPTAEAEVEASETTEAPVEAAESSEDKE